ncbi:hypothetical protein BJF89_00915 [Corynebacterium sp. CNJ-954]|nr:hypothetical protein BJF89_00915 [Corynebacterium sp. CNJ-954]
MMPVDHLPQVLRGPVERVRDGLLTDATALVILGLGSAARGISYIDYPAQSGNAHPAETWLDMPVWSAVWMAIGVWCLVSAAWHRSFPAALAVGSGVGIHLLWACSFLIATTTGDMPRGWVSSIGYLMIAGLVLWAVWRGSRVEVRFREVTHAPDRHGVGDGDRRRG